MVVCASNFPDNVFIKLNKYGNKILRANIKPFLSFVPKDYNTKCIYLAGDKNIILDEEEYKFYCDLISKYKLSKIVKDYPEVKGKVVLQRLMYIALHINDIPGLKYRLDNNIVHLKDNLSWTKADEVILAGTEIPYSIYNILRSRYKVETTITETKAEDIPEETSVEEVSNADTIEQIKEPNISPKETEEDIQEDITPIKEEERVEDSSYDSVMIYDSFNMMGYDLTNNCSIDYKEYEANSYIIAVKNNSEVMEMKESKVMSFFESGDFNKLIEDIKSEGLDEFFEVKQISREESRHIYRIIDLGIDTVFDEKLNIVEGYSIPSLGNLEGINTVVIDETSKMYYLIADSVEVDKVATMCIQGTLDDEMMGIEL